MSVQSAPPANARSIYILLIVLGLVAAVTAAATIGVIVYNYVTRIELREPPPAPEAEGAHAALPSWIARI